MAAPTAPPAAEAAEPTVLVSRHAGSIAVLTLNRPDVYEGRQHVTAVCQCAR